MATDYQIIGLQDATGIVNAYDSTGASVAVTISGLDTTTYPDRAVFRFYNGTATDATVGSASIRGKVVARQYGRAGYKLDDLLDYESIRTDGPNPFEMENEYLINTTQIENVADWYWKTGRGKHVYQCDYPGARHWFEVGDWYQLTFSYILDTDYIELIDSLVQVEAVETEQNYDSQGSTRVIFKEVEESWAKTQIAKTNLVFNGSGKNKPQRSTVVVGSSTYTGFADYLCDGTADDVEIQAAIDWLSSVLGGGTVQLTEGIFNIAATINLASNIILRGGGDATCLTPAIATTAQLKAGASGCRYDSFSLNLASVTLAAGSNRILIGYNYPGGAAACIAKNIKAYGLAVGAGISVSAFAGFVRCEGCSVTGFTLNADTGNSSLTCFSFCGDLVTCTASDIEGTGASSNICSVLGFVSAWSAVGCSMRNVDVQGSINGQIASFQSFSRISACEVSDLTATGYAIGFYECGNISSSTATTLAIVAPATGLRQAIGFYGCYNVSVSLASGVTSVAGASYGLGFSGCKSLQQCKATSCGTAYSSSYADSGTSNPCADTAAGGYNS